MATAAASVWSPRCSVTGQASASTWRRRPAAGSTRTPATGYNRENLTAFIERSLRNLGVECLDLVQLHCPPTEVYYRPEVFGVLDDLVAQGKIRHYGVSVEKVEEALKAIEYPNVQSVQIIFNMFRLRPAELFFPEAKARKVGILARVPLASGMLTGKLSAASQFAADDHRNFNRHGEAFDVGETFSGVPYEVGLAGGRRAALACPRRRHDGPARAALDPDVRRRDLHHSRRKAAEPGRGQRRRGGVAGPLRCDDGRRARRI